MRFRPPHGLGIVRTRRLGNLLRLVSFRATRIGPSSEGKLGPLWVEVPGGCRHHPDVGSRSADPIKLCVKSACFEFASGLIRPVLDFGYWPG